MLGVEGDLEVAGEDVAAAEGDDAEGGVGVEGEALEDFVDGPVAAAGEDNVGSAVGGFAGLLASGAGGGGGGDVDGEVIGAERGGDGLDDGEAVLGAASRGRVEEEDGAAHGVILDGVEHGVLGPPTRDDGTVTNGAPGVVVGWLHTLPCPKIRTWGTRNV